MGRQLVFFMSDQCQTLFYDYLRESGFEILELDGTIVESIPSKWLFVVRRTSYSPYVLSDREIDRLNSAVVECSRTIIRNDRKRISRGRVWFNNNKLTINPDELKNINADVDLIFRWVKKHVPIYEIPKGGINVSRKELISEELWPLVDSFILGS